jgi:long-chain acyl-CoA synthetase
LEAGGQAGLLEDSRGLWRAGTTFISGGAPLGIDTGDWFASVGISVLEGYGLDGDFAGDCDQHSGVHRMGSVGKPLPNVECKLARMMSCWCVGRGSFKGIGRSCWLRGDLRCRGMVCTGDIAKIDGDGFLYITDRKKELLKTSGGKLIAPQPIEGKLKTNMLVAQAALVGISTSLSRC